MYISFSICPCSFCPFVLLMFLVTKLTRLLLQKILPQRSPYTSDQVTPHLFWYIHLTELYVISCKMFSHRYKTNYFWRLVDRRKKKKDALGIPGNQTKIKNKKFKMCNICTVKEKLTWVYILKNLCTNIRKKEESKKERRSWEKPSNHLLLEFYYPFNNK